MLTDDKKINLPFREYYPIRKAVSMLGIELSDLFYFAQYYSIEILYYIDGYWKYEGESWGWLSSYLPNEHSLDKRQCIASVMPGKYISPLVSFMSGVRDGKAPDFSVQGFLTLLPISSFIFYNSLLQNDVVNISDTTLTLPLNTPATEESLGGNALFGVDLRISEGQVKPDDLFITFSDMSKINNIEKNGLSRHPHRQPLSSEQQKPSPKTMNSQAEFIYSLLQVYCPEALEHPHAALGKKGGLTKAFAKAGVDFPTTPETLSKWLKSVK